MLIWVDDTKQDSDAEEYEFAYKKRNGYIEKVVLSSDRLQEYNTLAIVTSDESEVSIYISDIPKLIKALEAAHSKAFELRKD